MTDTPTPAPTAPAAATPSAAAAAPSAAAALRRREPLAFALVLHPGSGDDGRQALLVSAQGETHRFRNLAGLVRFLAAASVGPPPDHGLR
jgi:hypothetical protein